MIRLSKFYHQRHLYFKHKRNDILIDKWVVLIENTLEHHPITVLQYVFTNDATMEYVAMGKYSVTYSRLGCSKERKCIHLGRHCEYEDPDVACGAVNIFVW